MCVTMLYNMVNECSSSLLTTASWNKRAEQTDCPNLWVCSECMNTHQSVLQVTESVYTMCLQSVSVFIEEINHCMLNITEVCGYDTTL